MMHRASDTSLLHLLDVTQSEIIGDLLVAYQRLMWPLVNCRRLVTYCLLDVFNHRV